MSQKTRLLLFQDACMWSVDPQTHKIDKWMLKFLLNHSLPLSRKHQRSMEEGPTLSSVHAEDLSDRAKVTNQALSTLLPDSDT